MFWFLLAEVAGIVLIVHNINVLFVRNRRIDGTIMPLRHDDLIMAIFSLTLGIVLLASPLLSAFMVCRL